MQSIGIDIEEISRFSKIKFQKRTTFYKKIFTEKEIQYCMNKKNPYQHFAVRFCAKEAAIKALQNKKINLKDIEVVLQDNIPSLILPNGKKGYVSLSHTKKYAVAVVLTNDINMKNL